MDDFGSYIIAFIVTVVIFTAASGGLPTLPSDLDDDGSMRNTSAALEFRASSSDADSGITVEQFGDPPENNSPLPDFKDVSESVGFEYRYTGSRYAPTNAGVYVADVNNDAREDVLALGEGEPTLFVNTGNGFEVGRTFDIDHAAVAHFFDYDNDRYRDLVIAVRGGSLRLFENVGGEFRERESGIEQRFAQPISITAADLTGNGCLDLVVAQYGQWQVNRPLLFNELETIRARHPEVRPTTNTGERNYVFAGNCERFTDVTNRAGMHGKQWTHAVSAVDFTGDGHVDIHVANDYTADYLYINQGNGTFERRNMGPASDRNAMSSEVVDVSGDLHADIFVTNIYYNASTMQVIGGNIAYMAPVPHGNNLFVNDGTGNFTDKAEEYGLQRGGWGWAAEIDDFSNDGHLDVIQTTSQIPFFSNYHEFNELQMWEGTPDGFENVDSTDHGIGRSSTQAIVRIDYNTDGALDFIVTRAPTPRTASLSPPPYSLYENSLEGGNAVQFFVRNPDGIARNAEVYIETDQRMIYEQINGGADYISQDSRLVHVGTRYETIEKVTVVWPDGSVTTYQGFEEGNRYILRPDGKEVALSLTTD